MQHRYVWPALLSLAGAIVPFAIVIIVNVLTITDYRYDSFQSLVTTLFPPLGVILLYSSSMELAEFDSRRRWGYVLMLFSAIEVYLALAFLDAGLFMSIAYLQFPLLVVGPVAGFAGGLWGVFWKRSLEKATPTPRDSQGDS